MPGIAGMMRRKEGSSTFCHCEKSASGHKRELNFTLFDTQ
jgi:hypothetical protein